MVAPRLEAGGAEAAGEEMERGGWQVVDRGEGQAIGEAVGKRAVRSVVTWATERVVEPVAVGAVAVGLVVVETGEEAGAEAVGSAVVRERCTSYHRLLRANRS